MEARSPNEALRDLLRTMPLDRVQLATLEKGAMNMSPEEAEKLIQSFARSMVALEKVRIAAAAVKKEQGERGE